MPFDIAQPLPPQIPMNKAAFDNGFLKKAQAAGLPYKHAVEALEFIKSAQGAAISGKSQINVAQKGTNAGHQLTTPLQAQGMQKTQPSIDMQSLQARQPLHMPTPDIAPRLQPNLGAQMKPQQGPPAQMPQPQQMATPAPIAPVGNMARPQPNLGPLMNPTQGPPSQLVMPQPNLAGQMQPTMPKTHMPPNPQSSIFKAPVPMMAK